MTTGNVNKVDKKIRELTADLFGQAEAQGLSRVGPVDKVAKHPVLW